MYECTENGNPGDDAYADIWFVRPFSSFLTLFLTFRRRARCFLAGVRVRVSFLLKSASHRKQHAHRTLIIVARYSIWPTKSTTHTSNRTMADFDAKAVALTYDFLLTKDKNFAEVFKTKFNAVSVR